MLYCTFLTQFLMVQLIDLAYSLRSITQMVKNLYERGNLFKHRKQILSNILAVLTANVCPVV